MGVIGRRAQASYHAGSAFVVYHLPAYVALQRWASGRTVVVVEPDDLDGARRLQLAGAHRVVVVGGTHRTEPGLECVADWGALPRTRGSVELVVCIERYQRLEAHQRNTVLAEGHARLGASGVFAAWAPHEGGSVDFWTLEEEFRRRFRRVFMLAELPWHGVSLAPVLDEHDRGAAPTLGLDESLLDTIPTATHYLAVGTVGEPTGQLLVDLTSQCLLVPVPEHLDESRASRASPASSERESAAREQLQFELARVRSEMEASRARVVELGEAVVAANAQRDELKRSTADEENAADQVAVIRRAKEQHAALAATNVRLQADLEETHSQVRQGETDLVILTKNVAALEESLGRATEVASAKAAALEAQGREVAALATRLESAAAERDSLNHQLQLVLAEREGARQLATRVEAELELARRRLAKAEEQLSAKLEDASRLQAEAEVSRMQAEQKEALLVQARSREERLSASAAENAEHGRVLTEVALDRDRLREELGRRSAQIAELEDRLWNTREEVQRERLDGVRITGEVERLREQAERSRHAEAERSQDVQRLSAELHKLELERADLLAVARGRQEDIARLRNEAIALASETDEVAALRNELTARGRELAELTGKLEVSRSREQEALSLTRKRENQLSEVGSELERLRRSAHEHASLASTLQSELDVKSMEVEQLAASVSDLQMQLGDQRRQVATAEGREDELQRDLERAFAEREEIRRKLREREQELEDLVGAHETSGVEVYKLRKELEAASTANEQLEEALGLQPGVEPEPAELDIAWPESAQVELRRLKGQVAAQTRRHAEQLAARDATATSGAGPAADRLRRSQLEIEIRGAEQEHMLGQLDAAEQRIWEMSDAADRNAARLAASLAQLEKNREELDETRDELEVTRKLLAASQARALEQERLLASERAKLARVGAGMGSGGNLEETVDVLFADLDDAGDNMVDLSEGFGRSGRASAEGMDAGVPSAVTDRNDSDVLQVRSGPRVVVEALEAGGEDGDEDPWAKGVTAAPTGEHRPPIEPKQGSGAEMPDQIQSDGPPNIEVRRNERGT